MPNLKNSEAIERLKNDIESEACTCKYTGTTVVRTKDLESLIGMHEASGITRHELKIKKRYFDDQISGAKNFELRKLDRNFVVGDELKLNEVSLKDGEFILTGNHCIVKINYILTHIEGLTPGYGILGTELLEQTA